MDSINCLKPRQSDAELALLDRHIPFGGRMLEFGCGGSTPHILQQGVASLTSVESDKVWLSTLLEHPVIQHFFKKKRWMPIHADIGPTKNLGYPAAKEPEAAWLAYHQLCWESMPDTWYDMVFIDGRFRVACFCQTLLRCANPDVVIIMHDFPERPDYRVVLEFADIVEEAETAIALRAKAEPDWKRLALTLQRYQFEFR